MDRAAEKPVQNTYIELSHNPSSAIRFAAATSTPAVGEQLHGRTRSLGCRDGMRAATAATVDDTAVAAHRAAQPVANAERRFEHRGAGKKVFWEN